MRHASGAGGARCGAVSGVVVDPPDEPDARALQAAPLGVDGTLNKPAHTRQSQRAAELKLGTRSVQAQSVASTPLPRRDTTG